MVGYELNNITVFATVKIIGYKKIGIIHLITYQKYDETNKQKNCSQE